MSLESGESHGFVKPIIAFAKLSPGGPIACDVTKTWTREELLGRIVGSSYVWSYGHVQCSVGIKMDRTEIAKLAGGAEGKISFREHVARCNVDHKDQSLGAAFTVILSVTPVVTFLKGEATAVSIDPVKTEGSALATAAVAAIQTVDKITGFVSKTAAAEINSFLYDKCKDDGVIVARN